MVVEPVEDLNIGAVGQGPVGEVGLPALVGLGCDEVVVRGAGPLPGFGDDQAREVQDAPDRGGRWSPVAEFDSGFLERGSTASRPPSR